MSHLDLIAAMRARLLDQDDLIDAQRRRIAELESERQEWRSAAPGPCDTSGRLVTSSRNHEKS